MSISTYAQQTFTTFNKGYFSKKYTNPLPINNLAPLLFSSQQVTMEIGENDIRNYGPYVPKVYNYHELAFFCKLEVKMEKNAKLPIKVRLGDVDYVDWLEGKRDQY